MNKIEKLQETKTKLKSEFVGINEIIDKVIDSITPWYLTPEVLERPVVVSLWGLTGTGKTSIIRKLRDYLDLSGKTLLFDCGEQGGSSDTRLFSEKLDGYSLKEIADYNGIKPKRVYRQFEKIKIVVVDVMEINQKIR